MGKKIRLDSHSHCMSLNEAPSDPETVKQVCGAAGPNRRTRRSVAYAKLLWCRP